MDQELTTDFFAKCRNNFAYFCEHVLDLEMTDYHKEIAALPLQHRYLCILVPRGHSKTSLFSIAYPLWRLFREKDIEICLVSSSLDQSSKIFAKVQYILGTNPFFASLLPTNRMTTWNQSQITTSNHNLYYTKPFTSSGRGMQPNYIIYDDLLRDVDDMSEAKDIFWSVFFLAGQANLCQHIVVGTPISLDDLYAEIESHPTKKKSWFLIKKPAVKEDQKGNWVESLWETRFSLDRLREIKNSIGGYRFEREMMCRPTAVGEVLYPADMVLNCLDYDLEFSNEVQGVPCIGADFAMSEADSGDFNVFFVVDDAMGTIYKKKTDKGVVEVENPIFIREMIRYKGSTGQVERIEGLHKRFKNAKIIGDNSGVGAKFIKELKEKFFDVDAQDFQPAKRNMILMNLRTIIEKNRLVIPAGEESSILTNRLLRELGGFRKVENKNTGHQSWKSNIDHDDCPVALAMAVKDASNPQEIEGPIFYGI